MVIKGRVRKFGDNIDTDSIAPGQYLMLAPDEMKMHAFEPIFKEFYKTVKEGDIILGGNNFGCGSSREQATQVVKDLGIKAIVCDSMARIYFRNCIALGVYPIMAKGASDRFSEGDRIEIDIERGEIRNPLTNGVLYFEPLSDEQKKILESGGVMGILKELCR